MSTRLTRAQRDRQFGAPGEGPRKIVKTPWAIRVQAHEAVAERFELACTLAHEKSLWTPRRIDGFVVRPIRGTKSSPSLHGYALAWDFFATPPNVAPPGGVWKPDAFITLDFYEVFLRLGFQLGALFTGRKDYPHIEWAGSAADARIDWNALAGGR